MSWRVVSVSSTAKIDYKMDYLTVRSNKGTTRVHLSEISTLMIESTAVSLTAYLLRELDRHKVNVVFCDETHNPYAVLSSLAGSHDTSLRYREQTEWTEESKAAVWAEIVRMKIYRQLSVLPPERGAEKEMLAGYIDEVEPGDITNREGHAAKVYFNALFGMSFTRDDDCPINSALNYGYSIILSAVAREIVSAGYCTQLGIFHNNRFNRLNFASDLMEPLRPLVDGEVFRMNPGEFGVEEKRKTADILNNRVKVVGRVHYLTNGIRIYTGTVFDALREANPSLIAFPDFDL